MTNKADFWNEAEKVFFSQEVMIGFKAEFVLPNAYTIILLPISQFYGTAIFRLSHYRLYPNEMQRKERADTAVITWKKNLQPVQYH